MELRTEIEIQAPALAVWKVLVDFAAYRDWNPFIPHITGELRVGAKLEVLITPPESREMTFRPKVLVLDEGRELRWLGHFLVPGLFDGEHFFRLHELTEERTRLSHGEDFTGILVRLAGRGLTNSARGFVYMNQALKRRVEEAGTKPKRR
jgi:hypothetical protein